MPPPPHIDGFDPRFFRPCTFALLRRLGYATRVSINNGLSAENKHATPMTLRLSAWDSSGTLIGTTGELTEIQPGAAIKLDVDELLEQIPGSDADPDLFCMFHVVPTKWRGEDSVQVGTGELMAHMSASDDFIEYHQQPKGVITGVAYQTGPMNDTRLMSTRTTVCQAPKVIVSDSVDTMFCLLNTSTRFDYDDEVEMHFWILAPNGDRIARSSVQVPGMSYRLVSATEVLEAAGKLDEFRATGGVGMFLGLAKNGSLVPISMTRNKVTGAIACDHTLPPPYYVSTWGGEHRLRANARLEQELFADLAAEAETVAR